MGERIIIDAGLEIRRNEVVHLTQNGTDPLWTR